MEVVPSETGTIETTTSVRPSTRVASLTEVEKSPAIRLRRSGYRTVKLAESVWFANHVQNLSGEMQRDLEITEQVPAGFRVLQVQDGGRFDQTAGTITWNLASLPAGGTAKLGVLLKAETSGEMVSRVKCSSREGQAVPILARVYAGQAEARRVPVSQIRPIALELSWNHCPACGFGCRCISCRCR